MILQCVVAVGMGSVAGLAGVLLGGQASGDGALAFAVIAGYIPAAFIGVPLGINLVGYGYGGNGSFVAAMGGSMAAMGLSALVLRDPPGNAESARYTFAAIGLAHIILPLVAWHLSAEPVYEQEYYWPEADAASQNRRPAGIGGQPYDDAVRPRSDIQVTLLEVIF
ncbi:MAG: hypothetical protein JXA28_04075 [Bacteroidetes bacterium]|nr:hypothetical protein [Bacteroidota bacterium]